MRKVLLTGLLIVTAVMHSISTLAQDAVFTWMGGNDVSNDIPIGIGVYGAKGVAAASNIPGVRQRGASWSDANGNLWLFGGLGLDKEGILAGRLNDLWKYNITTNEWTWISGSDLTNQPGVYGTKGVAAASNIPGGREIAVRWTDTNGNLWLFGGLGIDKTGATARLNDLWKYNITTNEWTWISGSDLANQPGVYGSKGVPIASNIPGGRQNAAGWSDANGNLWLFGGFGFDKNGLSGRLNDLWKYNTTTNEWTWISGGDERNKSSVYGTKGVASVSNIPGSRLSETTWSDANGNLWLFGGLGLDKDGITGRLNDLWKYNTTTNEWTWMSGSDARNQPGVLGIKGVTAASNIPESRERAVSWTDTNGNLWLFGGYGPFGGRLNDLWKYNATTNEWTWMSGSDEGDQPGVYGTKGVAEPLNIPGAREFAAGCADTNGNLWLFGGTGFDRTKNSSYLNDLWKYNITTNEWAWMSGSDLIIQPGIYGTKGVAAASNIPGARTGGASESDTNGNLWLFGGVGFDKNEASGYLNDLWTYDNTTNEWTWVSGGNEIEQPGVYGTKGVADASNIPGSRALGTTWSDANGNIWLFGGTGFDKNEASGFLNDLWKYNITTKEWTWISGNDVAYQPGVYGTKGVADASNIPGGRQNAAGWSDANGNLWLFGGVGLGGFGIEVDGAVGSLNDLWKYNTTTNEWTWMGGSNLVNQPGVYGTKGVAAASNIPGTRGAGASWSDSNGNFWLFGGFGIDFDGYKLLNDLWKYNTTTNEWTWMSGGDVGFQPGVYGTKGVAEASNIPGSRESGISWFDNNGNLWLFGGNGFDKNGAGGSLNDLWKYNTTTNQWTWIGGSDVVSKPGVYGTKGLAAASNIPGGRFSGAAWTDLDGNLWLFGGNGIDKNGLAGPLNDLWRISPTNIGLATPQGDKFTYGDTGVELVVTGIAGLPTTVTSSDEQVVKVARQLEVGAICLGEIQFGPGHQHFIVRVVGAGTATVTATINGTDYFSTRVFTVSKAGLTVVAEDKTRFYGVENPSFTLTFSGFKNNETASILDTAPTVSCAAIITSDPGTYPITVSGGTDNNYTLTYQSGTLNITKAPLTVSAENKTKVYGEANPNFTISYAGFKNGETSTVIDTAPTISSTATTTSDAGTYPITVSGGADNNYSFNYVSGTLTINKANQTIVFDKLSDVSESTGTFSLTASSSSKLGVSFESTDLNKLTISGNTATIKGPGKATVKAIQNGNNNYEPAADVSQIFCILPRKPEITSSGLGTENITLTSSTKSNIQWYKDGQPLSNETGSDLQVEGSGIYRVRCTVEGCSTDSEDFSLIITGVGKEQKDRIDLYPNPVRDELKIVIPDYKSEASQQVMLIDQSGRTVATQRLSGKETIIRVDGLAPGNYFVLISGMKKMLYSKFVKQ